jgi:hypothetical protein
MSITEAEGNKQRGVQETEAPAITPRIQAAIDAGKIRWNGGRLEPIEPPIKHMEGKSLSEIIIEERRSR